jgi:hypothetical protein
MDCKKNNGKRTENCGKKVAGFDPFSYTAHVTHPLLNAVAE